MVSTTNCGVDTALNARQRNGPGVGGRASRFFVQSSRSGGVGDVKTSFHVDECSALLQKNSRWLSVENPLQFSPL